MPNSPKKAKKSQNAKPKISKPGAINQKAKFDLFGLAYGQMATLQTKWKQWHQPIIGRIVVTCAHTRNGHEIEQATDRRQISRFGTRKIWYESTRYRRYDTQSRQTPEVGDDFRRRMWPWDVTLVFKTITWTWWHCVISFFSYIWQLHVRPSIHQNWDESNVKRVKLIIDGLCVPVRIWWKDEWSLFRS